jgi:hypothetical protein
MLQKDNRFAEEKNMSNHKDGDIGNDYLAFVGVLPPRGPVMR